MSIPNSAPGGVLDTRFLRAIEAWCAANGMSAGAFGAAVYRDRGFVASLLGGVSPKLTTVESVRASMKAHASLAEWREIRARAGAMPAFLTGAPPPFPEPPARSEDRDPGPDRPARRRKDRGYVNTREAAERLGLSPSSGPIPGHESGSLVLPFWGLRALHGRGPGSVAHRSPASVRTRDRAADNVVSFGVSGRRDG